MRINIPPSGTSAAIQIPAKPTTKSVCAIERIGVSIDEAAKMISLSPRTLWTLLKEGKIRHVQLKSKIIVFVQSLRDFVDGKKEPRDSDLVNSDESQGGKD